MSDNKDKYWETYLRAGEVTTEQLVERLRELAERQRESDEEYDEMMRSMEEILAFAAKEFSPEIVEEFRKVHEETHRELAARRGKSEAEFQELDQKAQTMSRGPDEPA